MWLDVWNADGQVSTGLDGRVRVIWLVDGPRCSEYLDVAGGFSSQTHDWYEMPLVSQYDACSSWSSSVKEAPSVSVLLMPLSYSTRAEAMYAVVVSHSILCVGMLHIGIELQHVSFVLLACWHKLCIFPSSCMVPHLEDISCGMHM